MAKSLHNKKRSVYVFATLTTLAIFLPFQAHVWSIYLGACSGYSVMVFGLNRLANSSAGGSRMPQSEAIRIHLTFLVIVVAWVWLCLAVRTHVPYILTTEDSSHPYFGLAFLGILGLLLLEGAEQRYLRSQTEPEVLHEA